MKYNKLVRDKIPQIIKENGETPIFHVALDEEYKTELHLKLAEEVQEFLQDENIEELADVLEVVYALAHLHGFSFEEIEKRRQQKAEKRGAFLERIILEETK